MIARFWWNNQDKENKIHWLSWEKLTRPKGEGGLGFRDIYTFNLSMLAKQCWQLLQEPNSLCAQILRAKYHPGASILQASPRPGMSYTWRSILKGVQILKDGMIWRVGNGENIRIWDDPWIPRDWTRKPITCRGTNLVTRVNELIDPYTWEWDEPLVRQTFWEEDVEHILSIPVHTDMKDVVGWHFDSKGQFSVRSAYKVQKAMQRRNDTRSPATSSGDPSGDQVWKKLWKFNCPNKIKHFLWRLGHDSIALRMTLKRRGLDLDTKCVACNRLDEDGGHLFFKCKEVKKIWRELNLEDLTCELANLHSARAIVEALSALGENEKLTASLLLYTWWNERNRRREGDGRREAHLLAVVKQARRPSHWERPTLDTMKLNIDGAFRPQGAIGGWGYVIRGADAQVVLAGAGKSTRMQDALHAEILAAVKGLEAAAQWGIAHIHLETDSLLLVQALKESNIHLAVLGGLVLQMKKFIALAFLSFRVGYCPRECNKVADALAAFGCNSPDNTVLSWDGTPPGVEDLVIDDSIETMG